MNRRTIAADITQPAADSMREVARRLNDEASDFNADTLLTFARELGVPEGPNLAARLAKVLRHYADIIERGEL